MSAALPSEDSFYLYDRPAFLRNIAGFHEAFAAHYTPVQLALSVKTNYLPALLLDAAEAGLWFEVVSAMEYEMVRSLGVPPELIVVNGPAKGAEFLRQALHDGALVQLDAPAEIAAVTEAAADAVRPLRVGLRINVPPAAGGFSRFGFDADADDFHVQVSRLHASPAVRLEGLHAHACTPARSAEDYAAIARRVIAVADAVFENDAPRFLNLGGGFLSPAPEEFRRQFAGAWTSFAEYGAALGGMLAARYGRESGPTLLLEPGLAIEATAMRYFTRVLDIRQVAGRQVIQVAGTCYDIKPTKHGKNLPLRRLACGGQEVGCHDAIVAGNTCMEDDLLHRGFSGPLAVGDLLDFDQAGAYTFALRPMFISPRPPVFLEDGTGEPWTRIEDAQDWRTIFRFEPAFA